MLCSQGYTRSYLKGFRSSENIPCDQRGIESYSKFLYRRARKLQVGLYREARKWLQEYISLQSSFQRILLGIAILYIWILKSPEVINLSVGIVTIYISIKSIGAQRHSIIERLFTIAQLIAIVVGNPLILHRIIGSSLQRGVIICIEIYFFDKVFLISFFSRRIRRAIGIIGNGSCYIDQRIIIISYSIPGDGKINRTLLEVIEPIITQEGGDTRAFIGKFLQGIMGMILDQSFTYMLFVECIYLRREDTSIQRINIVSHSLFYRVDYSRLFFLFQRKDIMLHLTVIVPHTVIISLEDFGGFVHLSGIQYSWRLSHSLQEPVFSRDQERFSQALSLLFRKESIQESMPSGMALEPFLIIFF